MLIAIVIPAFNELELLPQMLDKLDTTPRPVLPDGSSADRLLVLVDDGSTDGTADLVRSLGARDDVVAVCHERNQGKGAALRTGFAAALEAGADVALVQDADLEYDPADHQAVLDPILAGRADAVIGSRFTGRTHRVLYFWHMVANRFITLMSNMLTNLNLSDIECCSKAMTRGVLEQITVREPRFGVEPELVARLAKMRITDPDESPPRPLRIYEVAVSYAGRTYAEGKKITWRDGISALRCIVRYNLMS